MSLLCFINAAFIGLEKVFLTINTKLCSQQKVRVVMSFLRSDDYITAI